MRSWMEICVLVGSESLLTVTKVIVHEVSKLVYQKLIVCCCKERNRQFMNFPFSSLYQDEESWGLSIPDTHTGGPRYPRVCHLRFCFPRLVNCVQNLLSVGISLGYPRILPLFNRSMDNVMPNQWSLVIRGFDIHRIFWGRNNEGRLY
jgi:hypothetical protein